MIREVLDDFRRTADRTGIREPTDVVVEALRRVPRDWFVVPEDGENAWRNEPRRIACGQTVSQPFIVALMTELLGVLPGDRVLEIGTGSGYQTAVLLAMGCEVFSVEWHAELLAAARPRLAALADPSRFHLRRGDGRLGWPERAPFTHIVATAAPVEPPPELVGQLSVGGVLVIPCGDPAGSQELVTIRATCAGASRRRSVLPVRFVPMLGDGEE